MCVQDVLRKTFTAPQQINRCQNFDTINKPSSVSVGNCDHLPPGKPSKFSSQSPRSNQESRIVFIALLDQFKILCTQKFSPLANSRKLEPLPKFLRVCFEKKNPISLLYFGTTTETKFEFPCNTQLQTLHSVDVSGYFLSCRLRPTVIFTFLVLLTKPTLPSRITALISHLEG